MVWEGPGPPRNHQKPSRNIFGVPGKIPQASRAVGFDETPPDKTDDCDVEDWTPGDCPEPCNDECPETDPYACGGWAFTSGRPQAVFRRVCRAKVTRRKMFGGFFCGGLLAPNAQKKASLYYFLGPPQGGNKRGGDPVGASVKNCPVIAGRGVDSPCRPGVGGPVSFGGASARYRRLPIVVPPLYTMPASSSPSSTTFPSH